MHVIKLNGYNATVDNGEKLELGTFDSYGEEQLQIVLSPDWVDLSVIATFNSPNKKSVQVVVDSSTGVIKVPKEATADLYGVGTIVFVGLAYGVQRISADVKYIVRKHSNASGTEPAEPTPDLLQQVLTLSKDAQTAAKNAEQSAKNAEQSADSAAKDAADTVKPYKEESVQAATAAADCAAAADNRATDAENASKAAASSAEAAKNSAIDAASDAKIASDAATKVIEEGVADKLAQMEDIQTDVKERQEDVTTKQQQVNASVELARQAALSNGYMQMGVDPDTGHLMYTRTTNLKDKIDFAIVNDTNLEVQIHG